MYIPKNPNNYAINIIIFPFKYQKGVIFFYVPQKSNPKIQKLVNEPIMHDIFGPTNVGSIR